MLTCKKVIVSFSGGKDSTAMLLKMVEEGMRIDEIVFCDTGMEFPEMYDHISRVESFIGRKIRRLTPAKPWEFYFSQRPVTRPIAIERRKELGRPLAGYGWPSRCNRWCTRHLKLETLRDFYKTIDGDYDEFIGIASDEKRRTEHETAKRNRHAVYPLIQWGMNESDCLTFCRSRGFDWGGLYDLFDRVSCWCCPLANIDHFKKIYVHFPALWERLRRMDQEAPGGPFRGIGVDTLDKRFSVETAAVLPIESIKGDKTMKISKNEMIEAFTLRAGYATGKARLNAGKKFENRWHVVKANAEAVLEWLRGQDVETVTVSPELAPTDELAPTEEHAPADDEDGVREDLIKIFDITDAPGDGQQVTGKLDGADDGAVATDKDVGHKDDQQVKPSDDVWDEIDRMAEHESKVIEEIAAEESAKAADDVCAMVQAAETGEPMPETNPEDIYMDEAYTGLEVYIGPMPRPKQLPIIASDAIRKTYDELLAKEPNATLWMHRFRDDADHELVARLVTCACIRLSVSSAGHEKVCREINLRKIFEDGPMDEILGTITASRNNERVKLSLTREMVWDEFLLGESYHFSEGRTLCLTRTAVKHFRGIRSMWAYHHATHAAVVPCLECMNEAYSFIDGDRNLVCGNTLHCGASSCAGIDEGARREKLRQRVKKFEILKDFSNQ